MRPGERVESVLCICNLGTLFDEASDLGAYFLSLLILSSGEWTLTFVQLFARMQKCPTQGTATAPATFAPYHTC